MMADICSIIASLIPNNEEFKKNFELIEEFNDISHIKNYCEYYGDEEKKHLYENYDELKNRIVNFDFEEKKMTVKISEQGKIKFILENFNDIDLKIDRMIHLNDYILEFRNCSIINFTIDTLLISKPIQNKFQGISLILEDCDVENMSLLSSNGIICRNSLIKNLQLKTNTDIEF